MRYSRYIVGTAVLGAPCCPECGSRQIVGGRGAIGADKVYTDKATVQKVQRQLHALAQATGNSDFDPYSDGFKDDGVLGSRTQLAITAFNRAYGWPDDNWNITDGTLTALARPDVTDPVGYAKRQAASAPQAQAAPTTIAPPAAPAPSGFGSPATASRSLPMPPSALETKGDVEWAPILLGGAAVLGLGAITVAMFTGGGRRMARR